ncbi:PIN domain-containing protein [Floridanema aerugineum]|uniref:PIN domain-containing protein n=1 Tax=Floridaenema aerugineum BLCC-F46 TaxID=3153654 RepID=A0ABV4X2Y8_9CYAN
MIKRVLVDIDILLDILLERIPFVESASDIWQLIESQEIEAYVSITTLTSIFYTGQQNCGVEVAWQAISEIRAIMQICTIDELVQDKVAYLKHIDDEIALNLACAVEMKLDAIITRTRQNQYLSIIQNSHDSVEKNILVLSAGQLFAKFFLNNQITEQLDVYHKHTEAERNHLFFTRNTNSLSQSELNALMRYFEQSEKRLLWALLISQNASKIIAHAAENLLSEQARLCQLNSQLSLDDWLRLMYIILKYVTYAFITGSYRLLDRISLDFTDINYREHGLETPLISLAIEKLKTSMIKLVKDSKNISTHSSMNLILEITTYFDYVVTELAKNKDLKLG